MFVIALRCNVFRGKQKSLEESQSTPTTTKQPSSDRQKLQRWVATGVATHLRFVTLDAGFQGVDEHIAAITRFKDLADAGA